jgi:hypothetical protein
MCLIITHTHTHTHYRRRVGLAAPVLRQKLTSRAPATDCVQKSVAGKARPWPHHPIFTRHDLEQPGSMHVPSYIGTADRRMHITLQMLPTWVGLHEGSIIVL